MRHVLWSESVADWMVDGKALEGFPQWRSETLEIDGKHLELVEVTTLWKVFRAPPE
jgi:hypothetical protein